MKRRVFTILSAVSFLLVVIVTGLWVRSYWRFDRIECAIGNGNSMYAVDSETGFLYFPLYDAGSRSDRFELSWSSFTSTAQEGWPNTRSPLVGITIFRSVGSNILTVSYWLLTLVMFLASVGLRRYRRKMAATPFCCACCGYDLRASKEKCPECGARIAMKDEA